MDSVTLAIQSSSDSQSSALTPGNVTLSVNPTIFFAILDNFLRRPEDATKVVGCLLGVRSEDGLEIEARNSFAIPHTESDNKPDVEYFDEMLSLHKRVNAREQLVGWYCTGTSLDESIVGMHDFFSESTSPLPAVIVMVDPNFSNENLGIKAFVRSQLGLASEERGSMFLQIPCDPKYFDAERTGLDVISMAKSQSDSTASILSDIDNLERSILRLQEMLAKVSAYVDRVVMGSEKPNNAIGRFLMDTISSVPRIDPAEFEKTFNNHLNDLLMVVYLANLTRTQLAIAERLQTLDA